MVSYIPIMAKSGLISKDETHSTSLSMFLTQEDKIGLTSLAVFDFPSFTVALRRIFEEIYSMVNEWDKAYCERKIHNEVQMYFQLRLLSEGKV